MLPDVVSFQSHVVPAFTTKGYHLCMHPSPKGQGGETHYPPSPDYPQFPEGRPYKEIAFHLNTYQEVYDRKEKILVELVLGKMPPICDQLERVFLMTLFAKWIDDGCQK